VVTVDWGTAAQWAGVIAALLIAIWGAMNKRDDKLFEGISTDICELKTDRTTLFVRVDKIERDVAVIRSEVEHLPTKEEMHELELKLVTLGGKMDTLIDKVSTLVAQYARAEERVLEAELRVVDAEKRSK
jgi:outer membrane murein-binding lipoprotein Lpp